MEKAATGLNFVNFTTQNNRKKCKKQEWSRKSMPNMPRN
jgi:hypothetical protein